MSDEYGLGTEGAAELAGKRLDAKCLGCIVAGANHLHADVLRGNLLTPACFARHKDIAPKCLRLDGKAELL